MTKSNWVLDPGKFLSREEVNSLLEQTVGESTGPGDPLILSSNTGRDMSTRALEKAFKRTAARAGLPSHYSIHCLRHTYACELYRASGYNLRLVQKQLGHTHVTTTQVYADVMEPDVQWALDRLYKAMRRQIKGTLNRERCRAYNRAY